MTFSSCGNTIMKLPTYLVTGRREGEEIESIANLFC